MSQYVEDIEHLLGYVLNIFRYIGIIIFLYFHEIFYYTVQLFVVASHLLLITPRFTYPIGSTVTNCHLTALLTTQ